MVHSKKSIVKICDIEMYRFAEKTMYQLYKYFHTGVLVCF